MGRGSLRLTWGTAAQSESVLILGVVVTPVGEQVHAFVIILRVFIVLVRALEIDQWDKTVALFVIVADILRAVVSSSF